MGTYCSERRMRGLAWVLGTRRAAAAAAAAGLAISVTAPGAAVAGTQLAQAVAVRPPADAPASASAFLNAVSCVTAGACTAGGAYNDSAGHTQAMVTTATNGKWARGTRLSMPANAGSDPQAQVTSIDCTAAGTCVAVGIYSNAQGWRQAFAARQSHGTWSQARRIAPPANSYAPSSTNLRGVTCTAAGSCVAVGDYLDSGHAAQAMAVTESAGRWHQAREIQMPAGASSDTGAMMTSVACPKAGSCVATAGYRASSSEFRAAIATESGGIWHRAVAIALPGDAVASLGVLARSVSCAGTGSCVAVGEYQSSKAGSTSFTIREKAGVWGTASRFPLVPPNAGSAPVTMLTSVSCPQAGTCVAVGNYSHNIGYGSLIATMSNGKWTSVAKVTPPADSATGSLMEPDVQGVACTATGYCAVVGSYAISDTRTKAMAAVTP